MSALVRLLLQVLIPDRVFYRFCCTFLDFRVSFGSFGRLKTLYFASFGDLGAGWAQKSPQGLQKTHFGTLLGAIWEDLGYVLLTC